MPPYHCLKYQIYVFICHKYVNVFEIILKTNGIMPCSFAADKQRNGPQTQTKVLMIISRTNVASVRSAV